MKRSNFWVALSISMSLLLLVVFQFFWIRNNYERVYINLRKESNTVFRSTAFAIRDSIFSKNLIPMSDTNRIQLLLKDSLGGWVSKRKAIRSKPNSPVEIYISTTTDTTTAQQSPTESTVSRKEKQSQVRSFVLRMEPEEIPISQLQAQFIKALNKPELIVEVRRIPTTDRFNGPDMMLRRQLPQPLEEEESSYNPYSDTLYSEVFRISPINQYQPVLAGVQAYTLQQITPQILFSLFLTTITSLSFIQLYRTLRKQTRLMELKNDFIHNITHELQTPVATVSVALEALRNFNALEDSRKTTEYLSIAINEVHRLSGITENILKTSLQESAQFRPELSPVDLTMIVTRAMAQLKVISESRQAVIRFIGAEPPTMIRGNAQALEEMVVNLLENALKYTIEVPKIDIELTRAQHQWVLQIRDNGIGIPEEYQSKIFEKFFRVPDGDHHRVKGYGLGLSFVKSVVKFHNATIRLQSGSGIGSVFTITFTALP